MGLDVALKLIIGIALIALIICLAVVVRKDDEYIELNYYEENENDNEV